jgi:hypothetical protein
MSLIEWANERSVSIPRSGNIGEKRQLLLRVFRKGPLAFLFY